MPSLTTPDGVPVEVPTAEQRAEIDRAFARAMEAQTAKIGRAHV